jgi:beta-lactamase regulating signal transducer with metallopeptidase domain
MTHAITALGWTLIHFCWQAAAIALLYRLVDTGLSRAKGEIRYATALCALLSMLAAAVVTLAYETAQSAQDRTFVAEKLGGVNVAALRNSAATGATGETGKTVADPGAPLLAAARNAALTELQGGARTAMPWLDAMWLLGVLCLSVRTAGGWWLIQRLRRMSLLPAPAEVYASFARLAKRIGIERPIDLRISGHIASPLAMGVLRSIVLLPATALTSLSPEQLEAVLAHELAHIRRADYLWNLLQTMIETLFFFHPAVWWVSRSLRQQRELCCDDAALEYCSDPIIYATALLCLEEERTSRLRLAMALDGHDSGGLQARIKRILSETPRSGRDVAPFSLLGVCAMVGLVLLAAPHVFADLSPADTTVKDQTPPPMLAETVVALPHVSKAAGDPDADSQPAPAPAPKPTAAVNVKTTVIASSAPDPICTKDDAPETVALATPAVKTVLSQVMVLAAASSPSMMAQAAEPAPSKGDYIDQMRAAGYNVDLDKYVAMKIQGVTPEYARSMAATGFGKPTADELIAMKIQGVTPGEVAELKAAGIEPGSYQDLITYRIFQVSPAFVTGMKAAGYGDLSAKKLVELRIQGVTPEFAKATRQQWHDATAEQLVQLRIFNINEAFIASAKRHGLDPLTIDKLVRLRISGILDDETPKTGNSK